MKLMPRSPPIGFYRISNIQRRKCIQWTLYPSDTLYTRIEYPSADQYNTYTIYIPVDVRWDVLNDIMSSYYLHNYRIFGLNGLDVRDGKIFTYLTGLSELQGIDKRHIDPSNTSSQPFGKCTATYYLRVPQMYSLSG
jgi:hypothetical protein